MISAAIFAFVVIASVVLAIIAFFKYSFTYWERNGLESPPAVIPFGSIKEFVFRKQTLGEIIQQFYNEAKSKGLKHVGYYFFAKPIYIPIDRNIIKHIVQIDFDVFASRNWYANEKDDPLSGHLFAIEGEKWKILRNKLTQTFTTGQIKIMFQTLADISIKLEETMEKYSLTGEPIDCNETMARFTTDVIASCAFGIKCNTLEEPDSEFRHYGKRAIGVTVTGVIKDVLFMIFPFKFLKLLRITVNKHDVINFFMNLVKDTIRYRESNNVYRKDFMHLLLQLKNRGQLVDDGKILGKKQGPFDLTENELAAQVFLFYVAGFDTTATATSFALYELASNQCLQDKAREEINAVLEKHNGKLTYDALTEMVYLQQIVEESLRKYPPSTQLQRRCERKYNVPGTDLVLEKGVIVHIPVLALQRDPEYFPNPEEFDPERFSPENKRNIPQCSYMPFGEGPRICIALRFGILESKVALVAMLKNYKVTLNKMTQVPLIMDPFIALFTPRPGIWLNVTKIQQ